MNVNKSVEELSEGSMTLPNPQHVCCSPIFYNRWKISQYWSHYEIGFISENHWDKQTLRNSIDEQLRKKKKKGGVIFIGLTLEKSVATVAEHIARKFQNK